ncbi:hypothetical protein C2G38_2199677 [Gigaspora rosea]|uniref:Uncharacterized protein n=1 Tax=Gigaspora rosea TaxID=44941 RepID=A0A397UZ13_9GLOM|nr:hypothetical protein C2G38_2199677 [Gigaspora rosea]
MNPLPKMKNTKEHKLQKCATGARNGRQKKKKTPKNTTYKQATELGNNKPISGERETPYLTIPSTNQRKKTNRQHQRRKVPTSKR